MPESFHISQIYKTKSGMESLGVRLAWNMDSYEIQPHATCCEASMEHGFLRDPATCHVL